MASGLRRPLATHEGAVTRIIAGAVGGRRIDVPPGGTRPTSDRVREALFSALDADPGLAGVAVLDLCAGSGALGLEALSRGAAHALFVESDRRAAATLRRNIAALGLGAEAQVRAAPAGSVLAGPAPRGYDLLLIDPPYAMADPEIAGWLRDAWAHGWLAGEAIVVVERPARSGAFEWPEPIRALRDRRYGDTVLHVGLCYGSPP
ncbi:MAG TPA: 16S rRNA (guanine(966)-N(2))-methyltransferase RsmD [Pseudonocardia sp.]|uniref:16S rRNA (guanine(966)-N(2))-methyltransferase RsmD n=1 Tax=Pseudonocardia sp. TaxID=60912 RepID=UPI002D049DDB|nr:16S rRNA (guanine(966)-N(2))-methyltransferase RsmD [Pseudonocardia sp.]HTF46203.1 16S rRNA (guanine(966)-N(2))-methyltransferase RsmD [Pseudonocardia sp.]